MRNREFQRPQVACECVRSGGDGRRREGDVRMRREEEEVAGGSRS